MANLGMERFSICDEERAVLLPLIGVIVSNKYLETSYDVGVEDVRVGRLTTRILHIGPHTYTSLLYNITPLKLNDSTTG